MHSFEERLKIDVILRSLWQGLPERERKFERELEVKKRELEVKKRELEVKKEQLEAKKWELKCNFGSHTLFGGFPERMQKLESELEVKKRELEVNEIELEVKKRELEVKEIELKCSFGSPVVWSELQGRKQKLERELEVKKRELEVKKEELEVKEIQLEVEKRYLEVKKIELEVNEIGLKCCFVSYAFFGGVPERKKKLEIKLEVKKRELEVKKRELEVKEIELEVKKRELEVKEIELKCSFESPVVWSELQGRKETLERELEVKKWELEVKKEELEVKKRELEMKEIELEVKEIELKCCLGSYGFFGGFPERKKKLESKLEVKKEELEVKKRELEVKEIELEVKKIELKCSFGSHGRKQNLERELEVKKEELEVKQKELEVKKRELEVKEIELEVKEKELKCCFKSTVFVLRFPERKKKLESKLEVKKRELEMKEIELKCSFGSHVNLGWLRVLEIQQEIEYRRVLWKYLPLIEFWENVRTREQNKERERRRASEWKRVWKERCSVLLHCRPGKRMRHQNLKVKRMLERKVRKRKQKMWRKRGCLIALLCSDPFISEERTRAGQIEVPARHQSYINDYWHRETKIVCGHEKVDTDHDSSRNKDLITSIRKHRLKYGFEMASMMALLLAHDVESNPGPSFNTRSCLERLTRQLSEVLRSHLPVNGSLWSETVAEAAYAAGYSTDCQWSNPSGNSKDKLMTLIERVTELGRLLTTMDCLPKEYAPFIHNLESTSVQEQLVIQFKVENFSSAVNILLDVQRFNDAHKQTLMQDITSLQWKLSKVQQEHVKPLEHVNSGTEGTNAEFGSLRDSFAPDVFQQQAPSGEGMQTDHIDDGMNLSSFEMDHAMLRDEDKLFQEPGRDSIGSSVTSKNHGANLEDDDVTSLFGPQISVDIQELFRAFDSVPESCQKDNKTPMVGAHVSNMASEPSDAIDISTENMLHTDDVSLLGDGACIQQMTPTSGRKLDIKVSLLKELEKIIDLRLEGLKTTGQYDTEMKP